MTDKHYNIISRQIMNNMELEALRGLKEICNKHEGLNLRLSWGMLTARLPDETNEIALSLYSSRGFRIVSTYDYFKLQQQIGETEICGVGKS